MPDFESDAEREAHDAAYRAWLNDDAYTIGSLKHMFLAGRDYERARQQAEAASGGAAERLRIAEAALREIVAVHDNQERYMTPWIVADDALTQMSMVEPDARLQQAGAASGGAVERLRIAAAALEHIVQCADRGLQASRIGVYARGVLIRMAVVKADARFQERAGQGD